MRTKFAIAALILVCITAAAAGERQFDEELTDLWWNPSQPGWGMQVTQSGTFLFASLYVYGRDGAAVWYTAQMNREYGQFMNGYDYTGPLYATRGPASGSPMDPKSVNIRRVGTMRLSSPMEGSNVLSYDIDGVPVTTAVVRQPLPDNRPSFTGFYNDASVKIEQFSCPQQGSRPPSFQPAFFATAKGSDLEISWTTSPWICKFSGPYAQTGRFGSFTGNYSCTDGEVGTATF